MKDTLVSIVLLFSFAWNIFITNYASAIADGTFASGKSEKIQSTAGFHHNDTLRKHNKRLLWDLVVEELLENEEEKKIDQTTCVLLHLVFHDFNEKKEKIRFELIRHNKPPSKRLYLKFCSIKIPSQA